MDNGTGQSDVMWKEQATVGFQDARKRVQAKEFNGLLEMALR